jgi:hypothetical protein
MEVYGPEGEAEAADAAAAAASPAAAAAGDGAPAVEAGADGLEADAQGCVPFFFMDAYEAHDRPGARAWPQLLQGAGALGSI